MARPNKIRSAGKERRVRELAAEGRTSREIAEVLTNEGLRIGHVAVARFIREETDERRQAARHVAAHDAQESVPLVTGTLRELIELGMEHARTTSDPVKFARVSQATGQACRALHAITVGEDAQDPMSQLADEVQALLKKKRARS